MKLLTTAFLVGVFASSASFAYGTNMKGTPKKFDAKSEIQKAQEEESQLVRNTTHPKKLPYLKKKVSKEVASK